jgi:hypothetical protein
MHGVGKLSCDGHLRKDSEEDADISSPTADATRGKSGSACSEAPVSVAPCNLPTLHLHPQPLSLPKNFPDKSRSTVGHRKTSKAGLNETNATFEEDYLLMDCGIDCV